MATQKKIETVQNLSEKATKAKSVVLADYRGLKHKQLEELRKAVKKADGEFVVAKNTLLRRALNERGDSSELKGLLDASLSESTAALFSYKDEVTPLKELVKFFKSAGVGKTKAGLLDGQTLTAESVERLSKLPGKTELLGMLVRQLNAPIQGLHRAASWNINKLVWALNSIKDKKTN